MTEAIVLAMLAACGIVLVVAGAIPTHVRRRTRRPRPRQLRRIVGDSRRLVLIILGLVAGVLAMAISGWYVMVLLGPVVTVGLDSFYRSTQSGIGTEKLEALEIWTRSLAGLTTGGGLSIEDAIKTSLDSTPVALRPAVGRAVARLDAQQSLESTMRLWADEVDDQLADLVAASLIQGGRLRKGRLSQALNALASSIQDQVRVRADIEAERANPRFVVRVVATITVAALIYGLLNDNYSAPYASPAGQFVLLVLATLAILALVWWRKISIGRPIPRMLTTPETSSAAAEVSQ